MQPKNNIARLLRALSRQGLDVDYRDGSYSVRWQHAADCPHAAVLLPADFPVEAKALKQLANLATIRHPAGGEVRCLCATPDFHPGDAGVPIGTILATKNQVIPAAVGSDINCGMRMHVVDLSVDRFLAQRDRFVELLKGDFFFGTRDVTMAATTMQALFRDGILGWLDRTMSQPMGSIVGADLNQIAAESDCIFQQGSLSGNPKWVPPELVPETGLVRDGGLATIGGGNHFVEIQWIDRVEDRQLAHQWGIRSGQLAITIHSGSRHVGKYIGGMWRDRARELWPLGVKYPEARLFPLSDVRDPAAVADYLEAEATAANYAFLNRLLLAELVRLRLRQVYGNLAAPLVCDLPHNITLPVTDGWVTRKGACPAFAGQPVIIPGSMGAPSYLMVGLGNDDWQASASHGAGRRRSRFDLSRQGNRETEAELGLNGVDCITLREERRIEEAPAAYKPIVPVIETQVAARLVDTVARMQPILTFKA